MKNKRRIIGIAAAAVLAAVGTVALVGYVNSAKDEAVADEALVDVYVIDELVPKGADADTIRSSVKVEQVPARLRQDGAITALGEIGDSVAAADLQPGDQLLDARLVDEEVVLAEITDKVQVSVKLEAERAVGGGINKGDLVGVYLSFDPFQVDEAGDADPAEANAAFEAARAEEVGTEATPTTEPDGEPAVDAGRRTPNVSRLEFRNVLVTNVQRVDTPVGTGDDEDDDVPQVSSTQYVVTLALSPEESERFVFATEFGNVWLSVDPASVGDDGTRPVTLSSVYTVVR